MFRRSVNVQALYDDMCSRSPSGVVPTGTFPDCIRMLLALRERLEAVLTPFPVGRRLRLHGMSAAGLNGALVEVSVAGEVDDGRVTVKIVSASADVAQKYSGGLRVKVGNTEHVDTV